MSFSSENPGPLGSADPEPPTGEDAGRKAAIKQIERRRRFHIEMALCALIVVILVVIWATTEYHDAGGWPTQGFSQSSGIHDVWNYWIVYPVGAIVLILAGRAWFVYHGSKPISEEEIQHEISRQSGRPAH
jgi:H+/Cl- antiporter ClcA